MNASGFCFLTAVPLRPPLVAHVHAGIDAPLCIVLDVGATSCGVGQRLADIKDTLVVERLMGDHLVTHSQGACTERGLGGNQREAKQC